MGVLVVLFISFDVGCEMPPTGMLLTDGWPGLTCLPSNFSVSRASGENPGARRITQNALLCPNQPRKTGNSVM